MNTNYNQSYIKTTIFKSIVMNLSFTDLLNNGKDWSFRTNSIGYLYNLKEQKYLNCNNVSSKIHILPILSSIPSAPWKVNEKTETGNHIFMCGNKQVIDIAWEEYITTCDLHGGKNQQVMIETVESHRFDMFILHSTSQSGKKACFTAKMGRILLDECVDKTNDKSGQHWYWIPEILMNEMVFEPMKKMLEQ